MMDLGPVFVYMKELAFQRRYHLELAAQREAKLKEVVREALLADTTGELAAWARVVQGEAQPREDNRYVADVILAVVEAPSDSV